MKKYMIATKATHKLGDLSRELTPEDLTENLCVVNRQEGDDYIGMWVTGMGFFDVKFPMANTRSLTDDEIKFFNGKHIQLGSLPSQPLKVD